MTKKTRKANGEGTVTQLPSGKYRLRMVVEIGGVKQRKSFTASSPTACRKAFRDWLASDNKVVIERVKTVAQWAEHWLEIYKKPQEGEPISTYKSYKMYVERHINPAIGKINLTDVRPAHIQKLLTEARTKPNKKFPNGKPLSRSASEKILWALRGIFATAIDNNFCAVSPVVGIDLPKKSEKAPSVFKSEHMKGIVEYMYEHENGPYVALYLYSGLRPGEGFGLMWGDIDRKNHTLHIQRSLTLIEEDGKDVYRITPGMKAEEERITSYNIALDSLFDRIPKNSIYVMSRKVKTKSESGETLVTYNHHTHSSFRYVYYKFFDDLNAHIKEESQKMNRSPSLIPRLTPHKMRHTFATYLRKGGADLDEIRKLLGHKNISTTQIYDTVDTEDKKLAVSKLPY